MRTFLSALVRAGLVLATLLMITGVTEPVIRSTLWDGAGEIALRDVTGWSGPALLARIVMLAFVALATIYAVVLLPTPCPARRPAWANSGYVLSIATAVGLFAIATTLHEVQGPTAAVTYEAGLWLPLVGLAIGATCCGVTARHSAGA
jgi:hypothetical protein